MIPTATTCLHESAIDAHSCIESPLTTLVPSLELKENHAGIFKSSSSRSSTYAYIISQKKTALAGLKKVPTIYISDNCRECTIVLNSLQIVCKCLSNDTNSILQIHMPKQIPLLLAYSELFQRQLGQHQIWLESEPFSYGSFSNTPE